MSYRVDLAGRKVERQMPGSQSSRPSKACLTAPVPMAYKRSRAGTTGSGSVTIALCTPS